MTRPKALQLIRDEDISRGRYEVNGKRWRPANSAVPWERHHSSFEDVVELYRREDTWAADQAGMRPADLTRALLWAELAAPMSEQSRTNFLGANVARVYGLSRAGQAGHGRDWA